MIVARITLGSYVSIRASFWNLETELVYSCSWVKRKFLLIPIDLKYASKSISAKSMVIISIIGTPYLLDILRKWVKSNSRFCSGDNLIRLAKSYKLAT